MSTPNDMPPPTTKGRTPKKRPLHDPPPDPNANRADDYPTRWRIEMGKQTAKCMFCSHRLAGTTWCVVCERCKKRMCSPCWEGTRVNRYGEAIFEGRAQNDEGCWCRFPTKFDPKWQPESDARAARMAKHIEAEMQDKITDPAGVKPEDETDIEEPLAKRQKFEFVYSEGLASADNYSQLDQDTNVSDVRSTAHQKSPAVDSVQQHTPATSPDRNQRIRHLHNKTTVIIGAGVIGLAIARELAAATKGSNTNHEIIVVERRVSYAEEASRHCAGLITKHGVPKEYEYLLKLSLESWRELLDSEQDKNRKELHYRSRGVIHVKPSSTEQEESSAAIESPTWYEVRPQDALKAYGSDIGKISTSSFVKYLWQECRELDVKFRFRQEVTNIEKTKSAKLTSVDVARIGNHKRLVEIPCHNLIVAAGSQTLDALHEIVPWIEPRTTLVNDKQHCDWVRILGPKIRNADKVGLVVRNNTGSDSIIIAAQPRQQLLVASVRPRNKHIPFNDSETEKQEMSDAALMARNQLRGLTEATSIDQGRTTISTALDKLPLVCKIPSNLVDDRFEGEDNSPLGIYLAYGFGMYGTTMSLGVASALRRMLMGHDAGIGEAFEYP